MEWLPYQKTHPDSSVVGDLRVVRSVFGGDLAPRDLIAYLPPSHDSSRRTYPVLYMHDGHNLFDPTTAFGGVHWGISETANALAARGLEAIIIGIPCDGQHRLDEYGPWRDDRLAQIMSSGTGGRAHEYLDFVIETVMPLVNSSFRTRSQPAATGIAGSSMGGLVSLWAVLIRPDMFGFCGVFSPALWFGQDRIFNLVRSTRVRARVYLDMGAREGLSPEEKQFGETLEHARAMRDLLLEQGANLHYLEDPNGEHHERDWQRRFPAALEWFLNPEQ